MGARVLPEAPKRARRLHQSLVERRLLAGRSQAVRGRKKTKMAAVLNGCHLAFDALFL
ncbi:hypothetical protein D3C76_1880430 [compost metagenome]